MFELLVYHFQDEYFRRNILKIVLYNEFSKLNVFVIIGTETSLDVAQAIV